MKFPSFIKTAKYGRFHYEPRYYDPIKEEIQGKIAAAKREAEHHSSDNNNAEVRASSISAAFSQRERKTKETSWAQMAIAAALMGTFIGWLFWGNDFLYAYLLLAPVYFYFRIKNRAKKS
ncbi:hypothetical protein [Reichenbachiella versicolor]|uniref:hypothetical protein n=1 Tax=Reichenbachiella versicolor TaxID=1821036 RepID=UPI000D6E4EDF|nr:hypothetical protein [Reichenbachiella versicolor]